MAANVEKEPGPDGTEESPEITLAAKPLFNPAARHILEQRDREDPDERAPPHEVHQLLHGMAEGRKNRGANSLIETGEVREVGDRDDEDGTEEEPVPPFLPASTATATVLGCQGGGWFRCFLTTG